MSINPVDYAAKVTIDYPDRLLNRLTSFFRIFTVIPIAIVLGLLSSRGTSWGQHTHNWVVGAASGVRHPVWVHPSDDSLPAKIPEMVV